MMGLLEAGIDGSSRMGFQSGNFVMFLFSYNWSNAVAKSLQEENARRPSHFEDDERTP